MIKKIIINNQTIDAERIKDFYRQNDKLVVICTSSQKGVKYEILEAPMKEVEFVTVPHDPEYQKQIESEIAAKFLHDIAMNWNGSFTSLESVIIYPEPKTATESSRTDRECALFGPFGMRKEYTGKTYCKVGDEPKSDIEVVYPFCSVTKKAFNEAMEKMSASMKSAGESINQGLKEMAKSNESIKVDLSVDGEQLQKMIKAYGKAITRSGG